MHFEEIVAPRTENTVHTVFDTWTIQKLLRSHALRSSVVGGLGGDMSSSSNDSIFNSLTNSSAPFPSAADGEGGLVLVRIFARSSSSKGVGIASQFWLKKANDMDESPM